MSFPRERIIVVRTTSQFAFDAVVDRLQAEGIDATVNEYAKGHPKGGDAYNRLHKAQQTPTSKPKKVRRSQWLG